MNMILMVMKMVLMFMMMRKMIRFRTMASLSVSGLLLLTLIS